MCLMFVLAQIKRDNSIVDIGWGLGFIAVAFGTFIYYNDQRLHQKLITYLVFVWGMRLSLYIAVRNWGKPEDFRYVNFRKKWGNHQLIGAFFQVFMLQGIIMFINTLPVVVVNSTPHIIKGWAWIYPWAAGIGLIGFVFEAVGDWQMYMFKNNPHHHGRIMNYGLWRYTRHPNYFGEAVQWWAMFLLSIPSGQWYISIWAPITITFLLLRVSGVTMLEKKYDGDDEYALYKKTTSAFIPWFPLSPAPKTNTGT
jgi:steroid 5-alpha reductase family enzyme